MYCSDKVHLHVWFKYIWLSHSDLNENGLVMRLFSSVENTTASHAGDMCEDVFILPLERVSGL